MRLYDCKVRLSGSLLNEVRKTDATAAEILILRTLHGGDEAVTDIVPKAMDKRSHADERNRLWQLYVGAAEGENLGGHQAERAKILSSLFGPSHAPLPVELPPASGFLPDEPVARVKAPLKAGKAEDIAAAAALA